MRALKTQTGFTIVEALIVLAVTGIMIGATALLIGGQVGKYRFRDATFNVQQRLIDTLNDTQTGYFRLTEAAPTLCPEPLTLATSAGNSNCVYAGKRIDVTTSGQLTITPLIMLDSATSPINGPASNLTPLTGQAVVTSSLPGGVSYAKNATYYVLFTNYVSASAASSGGAQATKTFINDAGVIKVPLPGQEQYVCIQTGSRKAKLTIGVNGANTVDTNFNPTSTECPNA